jgi:hypothetical protein
MTFKEHCEESVRLCGEPFRHVHEWLDEFAGYPPHGMRHRQFRHHQAGIDEVRRKWGDKAALVARAHIVSDLKQDQWVEGKDPFPRDQQHYVAMGLF